MKSTPLDMVSIRAERFVQRLTLLNMVQHMIRRDKLVSSFTQPALSNMPKVVRDRIEADKAILLESFQIVADGLKYGEYDISNVGTHLDGAMHGTDGMGDMASYPMDYLVNKGVIVDVSEHIEDWSVITPEMLENAPELS